MGRAHSSEKGWTLGSQGAGMAAPYCSEDPQFVVWGLSGTNAVGISVRAYNKKGLSEPYALSKSELSHHRFIKSIRNDLGSSTDFVVANSIPKRDSEHSSLHGALRDFKFVDQVDCQCLRVCSICHYRQDTLVKNFRLEALGYRPKLSDQNIVITGLSSHTGVVRGDLGNVKENGQQRSLCY
ncbi:jg4021 [Pararge aegeria aegeria]|uniref:Jg4021 protein n=1 Tax=Pararge aegeria aegeria TaxID=348720 RepID=A0A8S4R936_9NEOP|nr:jg4021 [Pararge aegeria aegeria]